MEENKTEKEEILLQEEEVWDIIKYARNLWTIGDPFLSPDLINARLKDITLNPTIATESALKDAMKNPKENEDLIRAFSQDFEQQSMIYKRLIGFLSNMLSFDITYTSDVDSKDYNKPQYKKDLKAVEDFLDKFDYEYELRIVVREMLRNDAYFGLFIDAGNKYVLQELPSDYCKITGRWENGFLFSFNMAWFLQPGVDINMYPDFFKKKLNEMDTAKKRNYNPSIYPELRERSGWADWVDIPVNMGVCFKFSPELATRLPFFSPLFNDLVLQGLMRNLQRDSNMAAASKIILGEVPMLTGNTKTALKDSISISPELLGKFLSLVKESLNDAIKVASAPLQNMRGISFEADEGIYDSYLKTALASSGVNTNLIFTSDIKANALETQLSLNVDEQMMQALYLQFNHFMNYFINKETSRYEFEFVFEGTDFFLARSEKLEAVMKLFDKGIILPQKIAAAMGMKPRELRRHMEEAEGTGFMNMLHPPMLEQQLKVNEQQIEAQEKLQAQNPAPTAGATSKSTMLKEEGASRGRPRKKASQLGDEGMKTREQASNVGRGGKV